MAVTKASNSGIKTGVLKYDSMLAGNPAYDPAATWLIQRVNPSAVSTITFSSIPSTYQHLQLRINGIASVSGGSIRMRFNSDTGTNYAAHYLIGIAPSGTFATGSSSGTYIGVTGAYDGVVTTFPNVAIVDIHDYASTTKNKTARIFSGQQNNTSTAGDVELNSGLWINTSAINSITVYLSSGNYNSGSTIALYGFKG